MRRPQIAVVGGASCDDHHQELARATGEALARAGAVVISGGRGGVMEAASRGAKAAGGLVVGILPGGDARSSPPNDAVDVAIFTGIGQARNLAVVSSAAAVIAVGGGWGTLSEIALARKIDVPVVLLDSWRLERPDQAADPGLRSARTADEAVRLAFELID